MTTQNKKLLDLEAIEERCSKAKRSEKINLLEWEHILEKDFSALFAFARDAKAALEEYKFMDLQCEKDGKVWKENPAREVLQKHFGDEKKST